MDECHNKELEPNYKLLQQFHKVEITKRDLSRAVAFMSAKIFQFFNFFFMLFLQKCVD